MIKGNSALSLLQRVVPHLIIVAGVLLSLDFLVRVGWISRWTFPTLDDLLRALYTFGSNPEVPHGFISNYLTTLYTVMIAFMIVIGVGLPSSFALVLNKGARDVFYPLILAFFAIPAVILYPAIVLLFGIGIESKIALGVLVGLPPLIITTTGALSYLNWGYLRMARVFTNSVSKIFVKVAIPSIFPILTTALQLGLSYTFVGVIVGEMVASGIGMGFLVSWGNTTFRTPIMYAATVVVILTALAINLTFSWLDRRVRGRMRTL
ncbi:MAG: ABC transporter permease subunit [Aigarchaeota archaeon]|nr:ABC transporter permease subunit [Aigarchaeota archaeon]MDW8092872.1 ABC transporter permease subunit [Nitrososphaerota archaeon]